MNDTLRALEAWLKTNYRSAFLSLQPGLSDETIDTQLADWPFKLPDDVRALYRWRNGFEDENVHLLPSLTFLPLEHAFSLAHSLWEASAEQAKKSGMELFPKIVLPIMIDAGLDRMLLVQGFEATPHSPTQPHSPAQVVLLTQGRRLYGFEKLSDLLKAALELFQAGIYTVDQDHDTVSVTDEARAQAAWRKYPLLYLEDVDDEALVLPDDTELEDEDDDASSENMLAGLLEMLGLDPASIDPETATLEDLSEMQEIVPVEDWPEALQAKYKALVADAPHVLEAEIISPEGKQRLPKPDNET